MHSNPSYLSDRLSRDGQDDRCPASGRASRLRRRSTPTTKSSTAPASRSPRFLPTTARGPSATWKPRSSPSSRGRTQVVIAPGGGAVLREATRDAMQAAGPIVWLTAGVDTIAARLAADAATDSRRPTLTAAGGREEIEAVLAQRTPDLSSVCYICGRYRRKEPGRSGRRNSSPSSDHPRRITSMPLRLAALFVVGTFLGSLVNWAVYTFAWNPRPISPWSPRTGRSCAARLVFDRVPVVGWWQLNREAAIHGRGFGVRPLLVEVGTGAAVAGLYWWEVGQFGSRPRAVARPGRGAAWAAASGICQPRAVVC